MTYRGQRRGQFKFIYSHFYFNEMFLATADMKHKKKTDAKLYLAREKCVHYHKKIIEKDNKTQGALR